MKEKVQEFRGLSALLIGNKAEHQGKHLQLTLDFSLGNLIPHWVYGPGKDPALRMKKALEFTSSFWKMEEESRCFGTVSEKWQTQH